MVRMRELLDKLWVVVPYKAGFRNYNGTSLRRDLIAGLTVASVAVPQAMAYAIIAGIPPIYGLFTAIVMTALGSLFGSSRLLVNGPTNAISLVVFSSVAFAPEAERLQVVFLLGVLVGLIQILIALLRLGDLTRYLSESVVLGFLAGAGILVALSQVDKFLGLKSIGGGDQHFLVRLYLTLSQWRSTNPEAVVIGLTTIALIFGFHRLGRDLRVRLPELLLALILVSLGTWLYHQWHPGSTVEALNVQPQWPLPVLPPFRHQWIQQIWGGALAISLLGLVEALAIAKTLAARTKEPFDYNRQCLAEGLANLGGGLFQCMPGSGSLTRSAINYLAGAATRLSGVFAALAVAGVLALLMWVNLAAYIPQPALAGVLMWTAYRIVDRKRLKFCLRATRFDAGIALATAFSAVFISIEFSILIGAFLSFLFFVPRASRLHGSELVLAADRTLRERLPEDPPCDKMAILALEGNLFFGAAPEFEEYLDLLKKRVDSGAKVLVVRLKRARNPDMVCLELLYHFLAEMKGRHVPVLLCGVHEDFAVAMKNVRFERVLPPENVFREEAAVNSSTLQAVRRAYELLGADLCATCPRRQEQTPDRGGWYYVI
jgi:SulP family sulfate permease